MAWGRKAAIIRDLKERQKELREATYSTQAQRETALTERDVAQVEAKALKRKAEDLEKAVRERREAVMDREQEIHVLKARQRELEWAVHLLNIVLSNKAGSSISAPLTSIEKSTIETAREAGRERDIVLTWDDLNGTPEVHFPKKDERRAPWAPAQGGPLVGYPNARDLTYDPYEYARSIFFDREGVPRFPGSGA